jgi:hypothetical protein
MIGSYDGYNIHIYNNVMIGSYGGYNIYMYNNVMIGSYDDYNWGNSHEKKKNDYGPQLQLETLWVQNIPRVYGYG